MSTNPVILKILILNAGSPSSGTVYITMAIGPQDKNPQQTIRPIQKVRSEPCRLVLWQVRQVVLKFAKNDDIKKVSILETVILRITAVIRSTFPANLVFKNKADQ